MLEFVNNTIAGFHTVGTGDQYVSVYYEVISSRTLVLIGTVVNKIEPVKTLTCPEVYIFLSKSLGVFG